MSKPHDPVKPFCCFLKQIFQYLSEDGIEVSTFELDHICYRVETEAAYQAHKKALS